MQGRDSPITSFSSSKSAVKHKFLLNFCTKFDSSLKASSFSTSKSSAPRDKVIKIIGSSVSQVEENTESVQIYEKTSWQINIWLRQLDLNDMSNGSGV